MNKLSISIVIPAFNEEKYLPSCLASLKKQTYQPLEIIVVDNNSTDKTAQIAKNFGAKVVFEKKQGAAYARDTGFNKTRGKIIVRTDADGFVPSTWLARIAHHFKNPDIVGVTGPIAFYDLHPFLNFLSKYMFLFWFYLFRILAGHHQFNGQNMAIRKQAWAGAKPNSDNPYLHEDIDLACQIARTGKILFDPLLLASTSSRRFQRNILKPTLVYLIKAVYSLFYYAHPFVRNHRFNKSS